MALGKRLETALRAKGINQSQLAELSKTGTATIQVAIARDSERSKYALAWANALGISHAWLTDGAGLMEPGVSESGRPSYALTGMADWDDSTPLDSDDVELPLYKEVELAAGAGAAHHIEINGRKLRFSKATLRAAGVDIANAACATASGNSMEKLIMDGATIGIDRGRTQIKDGKIYAIDHDGMLRVKYLYRVPGGLRLRSENSDEHPDETRIGEDVASIKVLGWVFWWSTIASWDGR